LSRRQFLFLLLTSLAAMPLGDRAFAKDGESGSGGGGSGSSDGGSGDSGGGDSGDDNSGGGNSNNDNSGSGSKNSGKYKDQYGAQDAVKSGDAIPLKQALQKLGTRYPGKVISVNLGEWDSRLCYWFKVKSDDGNVRKVVMDAKTGRIRSLFGFGGS
jgi:Peptidase propeptide and YPEB domain